MGSTDNIRTVAAYIPTSPDMEREIKAAYVMYGKPVDDALRTVGLFIDGNGVEGSPAGALRTGGPYFGGVDEVRVVNPGTGGEKGSKLARFDLIPPEALRLLAEHYGRGALKYEDRNWERGYDWSLSFAAMQRHAWAFWNGEDIDPETGSPHLAAVAWHAFVMMTFGSTCPELDNRLKA